MKFKFLFLFVSFLLIISSASAQIVTEEYVRFLKSKLFDVGAAEYKLEAMKNGKGIEFINRSKSAVINFRLGCAKTKKNRIVILSERSYDDNRLRPMSGDVVEGRFWSANHGFFPLEECKKGKLAVIEVQLEDGKIWKLS
jgi:hypothetical protein